MATRSADIVTVVEDYKRGYVRPSDVAASVAELLNYVPRRYLRRLDRIVLTNASGLNPKHAARPTTWPGVRMGQTLGGYYPAVPPTRPAYIELFVDNIIDRHVNVFDEALALLLGPAVRVAATLFHEIGHHIHETVGGGHGDGERNAERWGQRLYRRFVFTKRPWLVPVILPVYAVGWYFRVLWFSQEASFRRPWFRRNHAARR